MRKADTRRISLKLTQHTYSLTPKRSAVYLPSVIAAVCAIGALVAAGLALSSSREQAKKLDVLCAPPVSEQKLRMDVSAAIEGKLTKLDPQPAAATIGIETMPTLNFSSLTPLPNPETN